MKKRTPWQIQRAVIFALLMRELKTRFGTHWTGVVWLLGTPIAQVGVLVGFNAFLRGNRDDNTIVKIVVSEDGKSHTLKSLGKSPVDLHLFANSPDNRHVVITSRLELEDTVVATSPTLPNDSIAILDTQTDTIVKTVELQSPAMVAFPKDGKTMYVNNVHDASVSVIDTATWRSEEHTSELQ